MSETPIQPSTPPEGQNPIYNRLLRAYAPIAALALILLLVAALVETAPEMRADDDGQEAVVETEGEAATDVEAGADASAADDDDDSALARNAGVVLLAAGLLGLIVLGVWFGTRTPSRTASAGGGSPGPAPGFFTVSSRLLRGYGPLAVFLVVVVVMGLSIPTLSPDTDGASSDRAGEGFFDDSEEATTDTTAGNEPSTETTRGGGTDSTEGTTQTTNQVAAGGQGSGIAPVTGVSACGGRAEQIPGDPYSPPCVAWGGGNNGGATATGVTADKIIVSYRVLDEKGFQQTLAELAGASLSDTPASIQRTITGLAEYFNKNFEFFGRKIEIAFYDGRGSNTNELLGKGRDKAQADALKVKELGAFADLSATSEPYADALTSHGVVGFGTPYLSRQWHEARAPYAWSLATDGTLVSELAAEYANKRLYGKPAVHADGSLQGKPRKFAVIAPENSWYQESVANATRIITDAGNPAPMNVQYQLDLATMSDQANNIIPKLKSAGEYGITTVTCGCDPVMPVFLSGSANRSQYFPEFIIAGTALTDTDIVGQLWHPAFARNAFGISSLEPFRPPTSSIGYSAFTKTRPGQEPAFSVDLIYNQMYMLAIGIQGAGPNLTPQSLSDGLFNYPERQGPFGLWRFGPGDRTAANAVREIYWEPNTISSYNGKQGAYVGTSDQRWTAGNIPVGDPGVPKG